MTRPRKEIVSVSDTPYYHVVSRCVRRAYLCGYDKENDQCYEHRRQWVVDRIRLLSSIFSIDCLAYAVMSNHFHICLKLVPERVETWSDEEIGDRWALLFKGPLLFRKWRAGHTLTIAEKDIIDELLAKYRERLSSLSWFMKSLNEPIAKAANLEDNCTGHFFESRFKSQALLTEEAVLSAMAYVDLNPVRAKMADTPEDSDYTSIQERIRPSLDIEKMICEQTKFEDPLEFSLPIKPLLPFEGGARQEVQNGILYAFDDYLSLVDLTGRIVKQGKRGAISITLSPILKRLNISEDIWLQNSTQFEDIYYHRFRQRNKQKQHAA